MDLFDAIPRYGMTLFGRGVAGVVVVCAVITALRWRRSSLRSALLRSVPEALVGIGVVGVWAFTVAPMAVFLPGDIPQDMPINLIPVLPLLAGFTDAEGWRENLPNLVANLVLYAPIGFGLKWRFGMRVRWILVIAAGASTAVEVSQALSDQLRSPDINDVLLNSISAVAGAGAFILARRLLDQRRRLGRGAASASDVAAS